MKIRLLPSSGADPGVLQPLTTFLVNDTVAIDAGSLGYGLGLEEQKRVRAIVVTHAHGDHIASLPVFVAEIYPFLTEPLRVYSIREVIGSLRDHVFNDRVSPEFHAITLAHGGGPALRFVEVEPLVPFEAEGLRLTPVEMNHTVPTIGLALEDDRSAIIVTSDTDRTEAIWTLANRIERLRAIFVDVSYPDEMASLASVSKHLTPRGLSEELRKVRRSVPVFAVHLKPQYHAAVRRQIELLARSGLGVAEIGRDYEF